MTKGNCFLEVQNGETLHLQAGSLLLLPHGDAHVVRSARRHGRAVPVRVEYNNAIRIKTNTLESSDTELICGRLQFDAAQSGLIAIDVCRFQGPPASIAVDNGCTVSSGFCERIYVAGCRARAAISMT